MRHAFRSLLVLLAASPVALAQPTEDPSGRRSEIAKIFAAFDGKNPGCAVGVAVKGAVVLREGFGMADLERGVAITPDTVFEAGSVTKQFTAATLMLLAREGRISLDEPLRKHLPELPELPASPTIRQVITHTGGLRDWRAIAALDGLPEGRYVYTDEDILRLASRQRSLNFTPGTDYSYSNTGYIVSTILVRRVTGKSFADHTRERIFEPLGMSHSRWRTDFRALVPGRALAYVPSPEGGWAQRTPIENITGAGGLLTTVGDLLLWNENFVHAKVGGDAFVAEQQVPAELADGRQTNYAAGLEIDSFDGDREVSHAGRTGGYSAWLGRYPDKGVSVAVLCNALTADATGLGRATARLFLGPAASSPPTVPTAVVRSERPGSFRRVRDDQSIEVTTKDGKTFIAGIELRPLGDGLYAVGGSGTRVSFSGGGDTLRILTPDSDIEYRRAQRVSPSVRELARYPGRYTSGEVRSAIRIFTGDRPDSLMIQIGEDAAAPLTPTFRDVFETPGDVTVGRMTIGFIRGKNGDVTALSVGTERVWALRFVR